MAAVYYQQSEDNIRKLFNNLMSVLVPMAPPCRTHPFLQNGEPTPEPTELLPVYWVNMCARKNSFSMEEAVRRMTSLPASNLRLVKRGSLKIGYFADLAIFNPNTIQDLATYESPKQYATGMVHVFVNGAQVLRQGEHTGAKPGRVIRGPGWKK